jgi:hypothetical protein
LSAGAGRPFFPVFRDTTAWAGFGMNRLFVNESGAKAVDNFQLFDVVPEPGLLAMLPGLLAIGAASQRRLRRPRP